MKRVSQRWERMCCVDTAIEAIFRGTENKRSDHEVARRFGYCDTRPEHRGKLNPIKVENGARQLIKIYEAGWVPSPLRAKHIAMPGQKERDLGVPSLTDHLLGWMLILAIQDVIERGMYSYCCGSIPGRGIEYARSAIESWVQHDKQAKYFVKLDIRHFYANIDNELLKAKFRRVIKDKKLLEVLDQHIDIGLRVIAEDGSITEHKTGQPVGTYPAPWFANFYLQDFDHHIMQDLYKERRGKRTNYVRHYLRYIDDMLFIGASKRDLEKAVNEVIRYCRDELGLEIKPCWEIRAIGELAVRDDGTVQLRHSTCPIDIVGYKFYRDHTTVRGKIYLHASRLMAKTSKCLSNRRYILVHDARALVSLLGWFSHADSIRFMRGANAKISTKLLGEVISYADKNGIIGAAARVYCDKRERNGSYHVLYGCDGSAPRR